MSLATTGAFAALAIAMASTPGPGAEIERVQN